MIALMSSWYVGDLQGTAEAQCTARTSPQHLWDGIRWSRDSHPSILCLVLLVLSRAITCLYFCRDLMSYSREQSNLGKVDAMCFSK